MKKRSRITGAASLLIAAILSIGNVGAWSLPLPAPEATSSITVRDLKRHLSFLASDELGGRFTTSHSNLIAARYLASELESYGFRGAARGGSFFQKVPLVYREVDGSKTALSITSGGNEQSFKFPDAFASQSPVNCDVSAELVFVGYGISSPANHHDDYSGLDVKGKIVLIANGEPDDLKNAKLGLGERGAEAASAHDAAAAIEIPPAQFLIAWEQIKRFFGHSTLGLPPLPSQNGKVLPTISAGPTLLDALAKLLGKEQSYLSHPLGKPLIPTATGAQLTIKMIVDSREAPPAQNVVATLEGADRKLKDEYVVFSAHYDHLETSPKGEVYNGADDDGSGTVSVLSIAQAFAVGPRPKRSILVVFHTGEELGLFGSEYNTDYDPVVPLSRLVADFNIDMVGRSRPPDDTDPRDKHLTDKNSIYVIGSDKLSTELRSLNEQTNMETAKLRFDYTYDDDRDPERFYYRSDHYNYAKHGVPIIFYFTGVHRDYHRTTDDVDKIDFEKMERIDRMIFAVGWRVANLEHRLVVDKKPSAN
jgi:hypothetical protein